MSPNTAGVELGLSTRTAAIATGAQTGLGEVDAGARTAGRLERVADASSGSRGGHLATVASVAGPRLEPGP